MPRNLVCVQAKLSAAPYETAETFCSYIYDLCERAVDALPAGETLLAFPEAIGFPLVFSLGGADLLRETSLGGLARAVVRRDWPAALGYTLRHRPGLSLGLNGFFLAHARAAYRAYFGAFAGAAKDFGVTIQAGSSFLPRFEDEPSRGLHLESAKVYNLAYTLSPTGSLLARHPKMYLTKGLESSLFSKGTLADLRPIQASVGKLGVAVCLDGFYESVVAHYDALGADILIQPSANFASWTRPWPADPKLKEGEAWLARGLRARLQTCLNLRYAVNPMLVGELWGLRAEGRSSISVNIRHIPGVSLEGYTGLAALADSATEEAFVHYRIET